MLEFIAFAPNVKMTRDGGYRITIDVPESEYENIKDLMSPAFREKTFVVKIDTDTPIL